MKTRDFTINMSEVGDAAVIGETVRAVCWMHEKGLTPLSLGDRAVSYVNENRLAELLVEMHKEKLTYLLNTA